MARQATVLKEEPFRLRGYLEYEVRNARTLEMVKRGKSKNVVTYIGRSWALKNIVANTSTPLIQWMMLGTDTAATNASQSNLAGYFSIVASSRITTGLTTNVTNANITFTLAASWGTGETHLSSSTINEFALLNSSTTSGTMTMFNRVTTSSPINFGSTNTLSVTITITN